MVRKSVFFCCLMMLVMSPLRAIKIEVQRTVKLDVPEEYTIGNAYAISEGRFIMLDAREGQALLYNKEGKKIRTIGRSGVGPGEMLVPIALTERNGLVLISDLMRQGVHLFRLEENDMKVIDFLKVGTNPDSICILGDWVVCLGYWFESGKNWWAKGFKLDEKQNKGHCILTQEQVLGMSDEIARSRIEERAAIGALNLCTAYGSRFYTCWGGHMRIVFWDDDVKTLKVFGTQGSYYEKPLASKRLLQYYQRRNDKAMEEEYKKLNKIKSMAATREAFYLLFDKKSVQPAITVLQKYSVKGDFLGETVLTDVFKSLGDEDSYFTVGCIAEKDKDTLYIVQIDETFDGKRTRQVHFITVN